MTAQYPKDLRSPSQRDIDKITFSEHFRLTAGKSQVHSPNSHDSIRSRLTHTLEVSRVGSSLARIILSKIQHSHPELNWFRMNENVIDAVTAGCLMHDIGNPPFGHEAERGIRQYLRSEKGADLLSDLSEQEKIGFLCFNGNMQALHIALNTGWRGHMNLSPETLASFCKYPWPAQWINHKAGIFLSDMEKWENISRECSMMPLGPSSHKGWHRHPFAMITEAADDICYLTADLEDAATLGVISIKEAITRIRQLCPNEKDCALAETQMETETYFLQWLRSQAITHLIDLSSTAFCHAMEQQNTSQSLTDCLPMSKEILDLRKYSDRNIYTKSRMGPRHGGLTSNMVNSQNIAHELCTIVHDAMARDGSSDNPLREKAQENIHTAKGHKAHAFINTICGMTDDSAMRYVS